MNTSTELAHLILSNPEAIAGTRKVIGDYVLALIGASDAKALSPRVRLMADRIAEDQIAVSILAPGPTRDSLLKTIDIEIAQLAGFEEIVSDQASAAALARGLVALREIILPILLLAALAAL